MRLADVLRFTTLAIASQRLRSILTALGIAIGIAAVILLTSIGSGIEHFVIGEFTQFGTNLLGITPGKTETFGMSGAVISTVRPITLDDEQAVRRLPNVLATAPVIQGNAAVEYLRQERRVTVIGTGPLAPRVWQFKVASGRFLPEEDQTGARPFVVLGSKVREELFGRGAALGQAVRIGGSRFRVAGVMEAKGQSLGFDLDDSVYIPVARAQELFNHEGLMEIDVLYSADTTAKRVKARIQALLMARHGAEDFTITTQEQMLDVLGDVLEKLTLAVAALGSISLFVGGVGILTIMTIAVNDRRSEIGLLRSLGATRGQILALFLGEATVLGSVGGAGGLMAGWAGAGLIHFAFPALPVQFNWTYATAAECVAIVIGLASGTLPARNAAALDPVEALRAE